MVGADLTPYQQICALGIPPEVAKQALAANNNELGPAIEWCFDGSLENEVAASAVNAEAHVPWRGIRRALLVEKLAVTPESFIAGLQLARGVLAEEESLVQKHVAEGERPPTAVEALGFLHDCLERGIFWQFDEAMSAVMQEVVLVTLSALQRDSSSCVNILPCMFGGTEVWWSADISRQGTSPPPGYEEACSEARDLIQKCGLAQLVLDKTAAALLSPEITGEALNDSLQLLRVAFYAADVLGPQQASSLMDSYFKALQQVLHASLPLLECYLGLLNLLPAQVEETKAQVCSWFAKSLTRLQVQRAAEQVFDFFLSKTSQEAKQLDTKAFYQAAEQVEALVTREHRRLYECWLHVALICWQSESLERRLYAITTIAHLANEKINGSRYVAGPEIGALYQMGDGTNRSFRVVAVREFNLYDVKYEDESEIKYKENINFDDTVGREVQIRCGLPVHDFHSWIVNNNIFEDLFGSHLHAQLLAKEGTNLLVYMGRNGLLTKERVDLMVRKVCHWRGENDDILDCSRYTLLLKVFAHLRADSQVFLLQAVERLQYDETAVMMTACSCWWWQKDVSLEPSVAVQLQMMLWRLVGSAAVSLAYQCPIQQLLEVFSVVCTDAADGARQQDGAQDLGTSWQWADPPDVDDSPSKWKAWSKEQLRLDDQVIDALVVCFDERCARTHAHAVITVSAEHATRSTRLWWIWQCMLAITMADSTPQATLWVSSILKLLERLLEKTPDKLHGMVFESLECAKPSVVALLLGNIAAVSGQPAGTAVLASQNRIPPDRGNLTIQTHPREQLQHSIEPRLNFLSFLFDFRNGISRETAKQCVELLSQPALEAVYPLVLNWLVKIDTKHGLHDENQQQVLDVLGKHSSWLISSPELFRSFVHFFIVVNEAHGNLRVQRDNIMNIMKLIDVNDVEVVQNQELRGMELVWKLALHLPKRGALDSATRALAPWFMAANLPMPSIPSVDHAYNLLLKLYQRMPDSAHAHFANTQTLMLRRIHKELSIVLKESTLETTSLDAAIPWLDLLAGLQRFLIHNQKKPSHREMSVDILAAILTISIDVSDLINPQALTHSYFNYDRVEFQVYPQTCLKCVRSLVAKHVGLISDDNVFIQVNRLPQLTQTASTLSGDTFSMSALGVDSDTHLIAVSQASSHTNWDLCYEQSISDTIGTHVRQEWYDLLFQICGASLHIRSSSVFQAAWDLLMLLPTEQDMFDELTEMETVQWTRKIGEWPPNNSERIAWVSLVKTVYIIQTLAILISPADMCMRHEQRNEQRLDDFLDSDGMAALCDFFCSIPVQEVLEPTLLTAALVATTGVLAEASHMGQLFSHCTDVRGLNPMFTHHLLGCLSARRSLDQIPDIACLNVLSILDQFVLLGIENDTMWPSELCMLLVQHMDLAQTFAYLLGDNPCQDVRKSAQNLLYQLCRLEQSGHLRTSLHIISQPLALTPSEPSLPGLSNIVIERTLMIIKLVTSAADYCLDHFRECYELIRQVLDLQFIDSQCERGCQDYLATFLKDKVKLFPDHATSEVLVQESLRLILYINEYDGALVRMRQTDHFISELWQNLYAAPSFNDPLRRPKLFDPKSHHLVAELVVQLLVAYGASHRRRCIEWLKSGIDKLHHELPSLDLSMMKELNSENQGYPILRDPKSCKYVGLVNQGSTCYQNAVLQQLAMMPDVVDKVLCLQLPAEYCRPHTVVVVPDDADEASVLTSATGADQVVQKACAASRHSMHLLWQLQLIWSYMRHSFGCWYNPLPFVDACGSALKLAHPVRHQNDASEFFHAMLETLSEALSDTADAGLLEKSFCGERVSRLTTVIDGEKKYGPEKSDAFTVLELEVKGMRTVQNALADAVKEEHLSGVTWEGHDEPVDSVKETYVKVCPPHLALYLKRYSFDLSTLQHTRVNDRFDFPERLDMSRYMHASSMNAGTPSPECWYTLNGVLIQSGSASAGHYYSIIRDRTTGIWQKADDKTVVKFDKAYMESECFGVDLSPADAGRSAYMIFYDREDCLETKQESLGSSLSSIAPALQERIMEANFKLLRHTQLRSTAHAVHVCGLLQLVGAYILEMQEAAEDSLIDDAIDVGTRYFFTVLLQLADIPSKQDLEIWTTSFGDLGPRTSRVLGMIVNEIDLKLLFIEDCRKRVHSAASEVIQACLDNGMTCDSHNQRKLVLNLLAIVPSLAGCHHSTVHYLNLFQYILEEYPHTKVFMLGAEGVPNIVRALVGRERSAPTVVDTVALELVEILAVVTASSHVLTQETIDALRQPLLIQKVVHLAGLNCSREPMHQCMNLLDNIIQLPGHEAHMVMTPLTALLNYSSSLNPLSWVMKSLLIERNCPQPEYASLWIEALDRKCGSGPLGSKFVTIRNEAAAYLRANGHEIADVDPHDQNLKGDSEETDESNPVNYIADDAVLGLSPHDVIASQDGYPNLHDPYSYDHGPPTAADTLLSLTEQVAGCHVIVLKRARQVNGAAKRTHPGSMHGFINDGSLSPPYKRGRHE